MALAALIVRIGADTSDLNRGLAKADRDVERFGRKIRPLGNSLARVGHSASVAAGSLSRLGGTMPGVVGGMGKMVGTLGTAGVVLGETAILTAGLTKGMRLLQAASLAVAASSAPTWLAALATPAGIAIAAIAALVLAVAGLHAAFKKVEAVDVSKVLKVLDRADELAAIRADLAMAGQSTVTLGVRSAPAVSVVAPMLTALDRGKIALDQWADALVGIRPVTASIVNDWADAMRAIKASLSDVTLSTREEVTQLYRMVAALREVARASAPLSTSDAAGMIRKDIVPRKMFGHGLDPRTVLGSQMDSKPTPMKGRGFFGDVMSGIKPRDHQGNEKSLGQTVGGMLGGAGGGMVQAFAAFGPMAAILPVINGALESLEPVITALLEPLVEIGRVIGDALAPVLEMLTPAIKLVADLFIQGLAPVLKVITIAFSYVMEAVGWLVRGLGRLVDALPGISAKGVINAGQEMIDAAKAARRNAQATDSATDAVSAFAGALSNVPRVLNINALRHLVTGGSGGGGSGGGTGSGGGSGGGGTGTGGGRRREEELFSIIHGDVYVNVNGSGDPEATANAVAEVLARRSMRGGFSRTVPSFA